MLSASFRNELCAGVATVALLGAVPASAGIVTYTYPQNDAPDDGEHFVFDFDPVELSDGAGTLTISGRDDFGGAGEWYNLSIDGLFSMAQFFPTITASYGRNDKAFSDIFSFGAAEMADFTAGKEILVVVDYPPKVSGYMSKEPLLTLTWSYAYDGPDASYIYPVPEPGTLALFALGIAGLGLVRRRKPA